MYKDVTLPEMYKLVSTVTVHVFCSVFIPEENRCGGVVHVGVSPVL